MEGPTRVEYSTIMKAPLRGGYKKGREIKIRIGTKIEERHMKEKGECSFGDREVLLGLQKGNLAI